MFDADPSPSDSADDAPPRILVALDGSPHSRAALNAAVRIGVLLEAELRGVFVEDESLIDTAKLPFAQEVRTYGTAPRRLTGDRIERQMRDQAEHAEHAFQRLADQADLPHEFEVVRGQVVDELLAAADDADLLAFGKAGTRSSRRRLGSKAEALLSRASTPVLVLRERLGYFQPLLTYYDGSAASTNALRLAARLSRRSQASPLKVLIPGGDTDAYRALRADVRRAFGSLLPGLHVRAVLRPSPDRLAAIARDETAGLTVLPPLSAPSPDDSPSGDRDADGSSPDARAFLYELDGPVLFMR